jgi:hypothetical protein
MSLHSYPVTLLMKKRFIILGLLAVPVVGVVGLIGAIAMLPSSEAPSAAKTITQTKPVQLTKSQQPKPFGPWLTTLQQVTSHGPKMKDAIYEDKTLEATGQWVTAHVQVKNTSQSRQSLKDLFMWTGATIVDDKGSKKDVDMDVTDLAKVNDFDDKPFKPGEVRTIKLSFDIPEDAVIQRVDLKSYKSDAAIKALPAQ